MAVARGATLDQAEGVRTSASASHNPYRAREAEPGSPSKSVTTTLSISVILLTQAAMTDRDTKVGDLCRELGVTRQTLYRFVGPKGELRPDGAKLFERKRQ
jgi:hypothetical protein